MSDDLDPSSLLGDPTAQEQAAAYAAALRKQQYDSGLLHVFGNKGLSDLGSSMSGQAQGALTDMRQRDQGQGSLLMKSLGLGRKKLVNLKNGSSVMVDPLTGETEELADGLGAAAPKVMNAGDHSTISVGPDGQVKKLVDAPPPKHGGGTGNAPIDPTSLDAEANFTARTGKFLLNGKGRDALVHNAAVIKRAKELHADFDPAAALAGYGANSHALASMVTREATTGAFEATAEKNLDNFEKAAQAIPDWGAQPFNKLVRAVSEGAGSEAMSAFRVAHEAAASEAAKVLSGALGAGATSDAGKHAAQMMLNPDATVAQLRAAANMLRQDMAARKNATADAIKGLQGKTAGVAAPAGGSPVGPIPTSGAPTHYLYNNKDPTQATQRRPADASGLPLGPPEPNPAYKPKVASRG